MPSYASYHSCGEASLPASAKFFRDVWEPFSLKSRMPPIFSNFRRSWHIPGWLEDSYCMVDWMLLGQSLILGFKPPPAMRVLGMWCADYGMQKVPLNQLVSLNSGNLRIDKICGLCIVFHALLGIWCIETLQKRLENIRYARDLIPLIILVIQMGLISVRLKFPFCYTLLWYLNATVVAFHCTWGELQCKSILIIIWAWL